MKSYEDFREFCQSLPQFSEEAISKVFREQSEQAKSEGSGHNSAMVLGVVGLMSYYVDERLAAYHNWLVAQLDASPEQ